MGLTLMASPSELAVALLLYRALSADMHSMPAAEPSLDRIGVAILLALLVRFVVALLSGIVYVANLGLLVSFVGA